MKYAKLKLLTPCLSRGHLVLVWPLPTIHTLKAGGGATSPLLPPFTYTPALHQSLEEIH